MQSVDQSEIQNRLLLYALAQWKDYRIPDHVVLIASHLEALALGRITRLIITLPPRHGKTFLSSGYFPAWYLGRNPDHQVIAASYAQDLAETSGRMVRNLIASDVHGAIFPESRLAEDSQSISRFGIGERGVYLATGVGGRISGFGAHLLAIDDPFRGRKDADSALQRETVKNWYSADAYTRLMPDENGIRGRILLISTRWHHDDLVGWLLREQGQENWTVLNLPAIKSDSPNPEDWTEDDALWPAQFPTTRLREIRETQTSRDWNALYQQKPSPDEGGIFKKKDWRQWPDTKPLPKAVHTIQSWDTAFSEKDEKKNSYSARSTWIIFKDEEGRNAMMLAERWKGHVDYPTLRREARKAFMSWNPDRVLIEKKSSGHSLIQDLRRNGLPVTTYNPDRDKIARAYAVSGLFESGLIWYPDRRWAEDFIDEVAQFPVGESDDLVDTMTQALLWLRNGWWVRQPDEPEEEQDQPAKRRAAYG